jgi:hypothetical protein
MSSSEVATRRHRLRVGFPGPIIALAGALLFEGPLTLLSAFSRGPYGVPLAVGTSQGLCLNFMGCSPSEPTFDPVPFTINVLASAVSALLVSIHRSRRRAVFAAAGPALGYLAFLAGAFWLKVPLDLHGGTLALLAWAALVCLPAVVAFAWPASARACRRMDR